MLIFERFVSPENPEISYQLADGLNHINIKRGDFRTLIHDVKDNFIGTPIPKNIPDWVIYFDRNFKLPWGGQRWPLLVSEELDAMTSEELATMEDNISFGLQIMLELKVKEPLQKFQTHASSSDELVARFSPSHRIKLFSTRHGGNISYNFQALGEQIVLYLAINYAYRCHYYRDNNPPFVLACRLRRLLEGYVETQIMKFIKLMSHQVIVINSV